MPRDSTIERYALAEQHTRALKIANQPQPDNRIRITRYQGGALVEVLHLTYEQFQARITRQQQRAKVAA